MINLWNSIGTLGRKIVLGAYLIPIILCLLVPCFSSVKTLADLGSFGGYIGGVSAFVASVFSVMLLYAALSKQNEALQDERDARRRDETQKFFDDGFRQLERIIERITYVRPGAFNYEGKEPDTVFRGVDGLYRFCVDCNGGLNGAFIENQVVADIIHFWLFEAAVFLRMAHKAPGDDFAAVKMRVNSLYAFMIAKNLNTLFESADEGQSFRQAVARIRAAKGTFDRALNGEFREDGF